MNKKTRIEHDEYLPAKKLSPLVGRSVNWIYYHSGSADGPIRRYVDVVKTSKGRELQLTLFHVGDCRYFSAGYQRGVNSGKLYPRSIVQGRLVTPDDARLIERLGLHEDVRRAVTGVVESYRKADKRRHLKAVAGGRR